MNISNEEAQEPKGDDYDEKTARWNYSVCNKEGEIVFEGWWDECEDYITRNGGTIF